MQKKIDIETILKLNIAKNFNYSVILKIVNYLILLMFQREMLYQF